jgi:putative redox protein
MILNGLCHFKERETPNRGTAHLFASTAPGRDLRGSGPRADHHLLPPDGYAAYDWSVRVYSQESVMPQELSVTAVRDSLMCFHATTGEHVVCLDYPLGPGPTAGPTPLQMLLTSLAVCAGSTLGLLLDRMKQPVGGLRVEAHGKRRDEHPTVITEISLEFVITGADVSTDKVTQALTMAEEQLCPVWAMLKGGTPISTKFRIEA